MSIEATSWALNVQCPNPTAKLVLIGLANHAHADGTCAWPSVETLAHYAGCNRRTAQRNLRVLADAGLIVEDSPDHPSWQAIDPRRRPTPYRLIMGRQNATPDDHGAAPGDTRGGTEGGPGAAPAASWGGAGAALTVLEPKPNRPEPSVARAGARGERLPEGWHPTPEPALVQRLGGQEQAAREFERFTDYWRAQPGAKGRKADWQATWRNWLRKAADDRPRQTGLQPSRGAIMAAAWDAKAAEHRAQHGGER